MQRWLRQGLLNSALLSGRGIERDALLRWAREHGITPEVHTTRLPKPAADLLADAIERGAVQVSSEGHDAVSAIELALQGLEGLDEEQRKTLLRDVLERERMATTALGHGVAMPHPRRPPADIIQEATISLLFLEKPVDWAAQDGEPVFAVFLILSPNATVHLQVLGRIAFMLRNPGFRVMLERFRSQQELVDYLRTIRREP